MFVSDLVGNPEDRFSRDMAQMMFGSLLLQDYMILDEGHKIKNPTKTSKGVHAIPARNRIILTGTPVQNNLKVK